MPDSPIDNVLAAARAALTERLADSVDRVARVRAAADAYLHAVEQEVAAQLARNLGLDFKPTGPTPLRAALDLRAAVDSLPEAHVRSDASSPSVPPPARASLPPPEPRPSREPRPETPTNPLTDELLRELRASNLDEMPPDLFRVHAEEFAARARHLQELLSERPGDVEALGRVIRTLTAMVSKRGLTGIYGLSRSHAADWQARADDAARRKQRMLSMPPAEPAPAEAPATRVSLGPGANLDPASLETIAPARESGDEEDEPASTEGVADTPLDLHYLANATNTEGAVVIVGGAVRPEKLERLRRRTRVAFEWVGLEHGGSHAVAALEKRIREGRIAALVVLQDLIAHKHFDPLVQAARQAGLPWAYGGKAGKATLERALFELESILAQRATAPRPPV